MGKTKVDDVLKIMAIIYIAIASITSLVVASLLLCTMNSINKKLDANPQVVEKPVEVQEDEIDISTTEEPIITPQDTRNNEQYAQYDQVVVTGSGIFSLVEKFSKDNIAISVCTDEADLEVIKEYDTNMVGNIWFIKNDLNGEFLPEDSENLQITHSRDITNKDYIDPSSEF